MTTTTTKATNRSLCKAVLAALVLAAGLSGLAAKPAHAEIATVTNANDSGSGSLRNAIQVANAEPGQDIINFNIPGSGVKTINVGTSGNGKLPTLTDPAGVIINGYSQPGSSPNTLSTGSNANILIELNGDGVASSSIGLQVNSSNNVVKGLAINRFSNGVLIPTGGSAKIEGNFIGTDPSGTLDRGNGLGVSIHGANNNKVGGSTPGVRNLISGNGGYGVRVQADSPGQATGNVVSGNLIGTKKDGTTALGNSDDGVHIEGASDTTIGGDTLASANAIAFNGDEGVAVFNSIPLTDTFDVVPTGVRILRNSIFSNTGEGIDLKGDGPTANDSGDADSGPNGLQNKPVLSSAKSSASSTTLQGTLNSKPNKTYTLRFFSSPSGDEGKVFRGQKSVTTGANGNAAFSFSPANRVGVGQTMTATATDSDGNTSEFSAPQTVAAQ